MNFKYRLRCRRHRDFEIMYRYVTVNRNITDAVDSRALMIEALETFMKNPSNEDVVVLGIESVRETRATAAEDLTHSAKLVQCEWEHNTNDSATMRDCICRWLRAGLELISGDIQYLIEYAGEQDTVIPEDIYKDANPPTVEIICKGGVVSDVLTDGTDIQHAVVVYQANDTEDGPDAEDNDVTRLQRYYDTHLSQGFRSLAYTVRNVGDMPSVTSEPQTIKYDARSHTVNMSPEAYIECLNLLIHAHGEESNAKSAITLANCMTALANCSVEMCDSETVVAIWPDALAEYIYGIIDLLGDGIASLDENDLAIFMKINTVLTCHDLWLKGEKRSNGQGTDL